MPDPTFLKITAQRLQGVAVSAHSLVIAHEERPIWLTSRVAADQTECGHRDSIEALWLPR